MIFCEIKLHIQFYFHRYGLGDIAIDDIVVSSSCPVEERLCTFEDPVMCNYVNDPLAQYNWTHTTGLDEIISSAKPKIDHTDGTSFGAYAIVDISQSSTEHTDQRARLISPSITPNGEQCVEFWYYFDGDVLSASSKLNVYVRANSAQSNSSNYLIWSRSLPQVKFEKFSFEKFK